MAQSTQVKARLSQLMKSLRCLASMAAHSGAQGGDARQPKKCEGQFYFFFFFCQSKFSGRSEVADQILDRVAHQDMAEARSAKTRRQ